PCPRAPAPRRAAARPTPARPRRAPRARAASLPHVRGDLDDQPQLRPLLLDRERVALDRRREAALRREAQLLERHVLRGFVDAALERIGVLQRAGLRGDE